MRIHHICIQTNCYNESKMFYTDIIIYNVENSKLVKIIAPEGTIVEIRDNENI